MSRWHKEDCRAPVVVLRDLQPTCKSCSGVFSLETTIASQQCGQRSFEKLPPDRAQGQLNLWWPPSVKYVNGQEPHQHNNDMTERSQTQPREDDMTTPQPAASTSIMNGTYGKTLPQGSFRLICMQGTTEPGEPIHVELETYRHSHCPSYETVSYAWGGETGDSSPCRPIFVGPYWDVLLQTENCWQMLRYARPTRGIRLLWVDAICINQDNDEERAAQVAMMAQIYNFCERTLVYLGPEVVKWHGEHLPERKGLHELAGAGQSGDHAKAEDHRRLLESRKYFTRLWIIQELILSPKVIIPIGNVIYRADHTTGSRLQGASQTGAWDWWDNTVPWAKSMGKEEFPVQNASEALLLTTQNQSSDPRDRLFGVLALLKSDNVTNPPFRANYTLSNQHVWIGFFAHAIANDGALWVLHNASGHRAVASVPSWAPDWNSHNMWSGFSRHVLSETAKSEFGQWLDTRSEEVRYMSGSDLSVPWSHWKQDIATDAASGALIGVGAMRLFTFVEKPKFCGISATRGYCAFRVEDNVCFCLASSERLDDVVQPLTDHLYLLRAGRERIFLVLREQESTTLKFGKGSSYLLRYPSTPGARRCRLIASCTSLPVSHASRYPTPFNMARVLNPENHISGLRESFSEGLHGAVPLVPLVRDLWGFLPLYCMYVMEEDGRVPTTDYSDGILPDAYLACLPAGYHKRIEQSYVTLIATNGSDATIQEVNDWLTHVFTMWFDHKDIMLEGHIDWEWSVDNTRWTKLLVVYRELSHAEAAYSEDEQSDGTADDTWTFNLIPCSQVSGATAGAILDHGITIPKGDGTVRLRAPTQSILRCIEAFQSTIAFYNINMKLHDLAKYLNLTSREEVRDVLLDTSRDWSHFNFQSRGLRDAARQQTIQFPYEIQLIDIF